MKALRKYVLAAFILISISSVVGLYWQSKVLSEHHRNYILREGMWSIMENERTFLNLREIVRRISLGDAISPETYMDYRAAAFFRADITRRFATDNPNFSEEEYTLLAKIDENAREYTTIDKRAMPDQAAATRLLPLIESSVSLSHTLLNLRRDVTYETNRETFAHINQLWTFLVVTVAALLAALLAMIVITHQTASKEAEREVAAYRYHMTKELHDAMNYHLAIVMHKLDRALRHLGKKSEIVYTEISEAKIRAKLALDDTRATILALRDGNIQPLETTIRTLAPNDDKLSTIVTMTGRPYHLPDDVAFAVYRVVQEAFANTIKHAPSTTQIMVELIYQPDHLILQILDNGSGITTPGNDLGIGLIGMRDRVEQLGGTLQCGPTGRGYQIRAEIPTETNDAAYSRVNYG